VSISSRRSALKVARSSTWNSTEPYPASSIWLSWQLTRSEFFNSQLAYDIAVDPTDSQRVYLAAGEEVLVSRDGGSTFSHALLPNRQGLLIRIECGLDGVVYAPDGANMYRSQDRGQTWQQTGSYPQRTT
jgi:hypothetical protein